MISKDLKKGLVYMFKEWGESNNTNYTFLKKKYGMEIELIRITPRY